MLNRQIFSHFVDQLSIRRLFFAQAALNRALEGSGARGSYQVPGRRAVADRQRKHRYGLKPLSSRDAQVADLSSVFERRRGSRYW